MTALFGVGAMLGFALYAETLGGAERGPMMPPATPAGRVSEIRLSGPSFRLGNR